MVLKSRLIIHSWYALGKKGGMIHRFLKKDNEAPSIQLRIDKWITIFYIIAHMIDNNIRNHY